MKTLTNITIIAFIIMAVILFIQLPIWAAVICTIIGAIILIIVYTAFVDEFFRNDVPEYREENL